VAADRAPAAAQGGRIPVWDAAVRACHAALAGLVLFDLVVDDGGPVHRNVGYVAVAVVLVRWLWAAVARGEARFGALKPSLAATRRYLRAGTPRTLGHDPLGVWMVWLLWSLVLLLGVTGWMSRLDAFWGDDRVHDVHAWLADALLLAVALHLAGVAFMSWRWRENLPAAMVTGKKRGPDGAAPR
jgi:cytochrome b